MVVNMTSEYLTVSELSLRIKYTEQSIYNLIFTGIFIEGRHFFKPTPKKILFKWQEIIQWVEGDRNAAINSEIITNQDPFDSNKPKEKPRQNKICI